MIGFFCIVQLGALIIELLQPSHSVGKRPVYFFFQLT